MIKLNGETIVTELFPNNETKVKDIKLSNIKLARNLIELKYESISDLVTLMFVKKRLDEELVTSTLFIWELKCSRYIHNFIKWLGFEAVYTPNKNACVKMDNFQTALVSCDTVNELPKLCDVSDWFEIGQKEIEYLRNDHISFDDKGGALKTVNLEDDRIGFEEVPCIKLNYGKNILEFKYSSDEDLIALMLTRIAFDEHSMPCTLFVWYMPYSRMDRKIQGDLFTLEYVCDFIGFLNFDTVYVMEPHSEVTAKELEIAKNLYKRKTSIHPIYPACDWLSKVQEEIGFTEYDHIVFPDKGAAARYKDKGYKNVCIMKKERNPATGQILNMTLKEGHVNPGSKCIIIDDLCSKGGTFAWAASILKEYGASEVYLIVTHCEKTIFEGSLLESDSPIEKVYTSTSMMSKEHPKIKYMDVDVKNYIN